jgi:hypothetical protein
MTVLTQVSEAVFAAIVRALILIARKIVPGLDTLWPTWKWKNMATFGGSVTVAIALWAVVCPLDWADIPQYQPRCTTEGFLLDALYPGFLAFLLNFTGEEGFKWLRRRRHLTAHNFVSWFGSLFFYLILAITLLDVFLVGSSFSVLATVGVTFWMIAGGALVSTFAANIPGAVPTIFQLEPSSDTIIMAVILLVKAVLLFLPLDPFTKQVIVAVLNLLLLIFGNSMARYYGR